MRYLFWDAPRGALQNSVGTSQVPCLCDSKWQSVWPEDPMALAPEGIAPSCRSNPLASVTAPNELRTLEPAEEAPLEELVLMPRQRPPHPLAFPSHGLITLTYHNWNR